MARDGGARGGNGAESWQAANLIGGTGLYFHAAMHGLAPVPEIPPDIHASCIADHAARGGAAFRKDLFKLDPALAAQLTMGTASVLSAPWGWFAPLDGLERLAIRSA